MAEPSQFTEEFARALVNTPAWRRYVIALMGRLRDWQIGMVADDQSSRERLAGAIAELMYVLEHPYKLCGRESPVEALAKQGWLREWMGLGVLVEVSPEDWDAFQRWQSQQAKTEGGDAHPWDDPTKGRVSGVV